MSTTRYWRNGATAGQHRGGKELPPVTALRPQLVADLEEQLVRGRTFVLLRVVAFTEPAVQLDHDEQRHRHQEEVQACRGELAEFDVAAVDADVLLREIRLVAAEDGPDEPAEDAGLVRAAGEGVDDGLEGGTHHERNRDVDDVAAVDEVLAGEVFVQAPEIGDGIAVENDSRRRGRGRVELRVLMSQDAEQGKEYYLHIVFKATNTPIHDIYYGNSNSLIPLYAICNYTVDGGDPAPALHITQSVSNNVYTFMLYLDLGLNLATRPTGDCYFYFYDESSIFNPYVTYYTESPAVYYNVQPIINYTSASLSVYSKTESDNQYARTYLLPPNGDSNAWVWVGTYNSVAADTGDFASDLRLEFTAHSNYNSSSSNDSMLTLRFKAGTSSGSFKGNGQAYYMGANRIPSEIRIQQGGLDPNRYYVYAYMSVNANGSSVTAQCNNFVYVGNIVTGNSVPSVGSDTISIVAYKVYTSEDIAGQSYVLNINQVSGAENFVMGVIGQSIQSTGNVQGKLYYNPLNTGIGIYPVNLNGRIDPLNGSDNISVA